MKAPQFWHTKNIISYMLLPASWLYCAGHNLKLFFSRAQKINKPVICVGNIVAGGAGKTPVAIAIGKIFQEMNVNFAYLSGGYGGKITDFTLVNNIYHSAWHVGDEPLLLSEIAPTFICKNRLIGAERIAKMDNKKVIIMDDGLQNGSIKKDLAIVVIDGKYGFGNGFKIPAGALREDVSSIKKADLVVIVGEDKWNIAKNYCQDVAVVKAKIKPLDAEKFMHKPIVAFCGIGRPEKFFDSLEKSGAIVITKFSYPDHYFYKESEIKRMIGLAEINSAKIVTTKKDWVRLKKEYQKLIDYLDIEIEFEDKNLIKEKLISLIK